MYEDQNFQEYCDENEDFLIQQELKQKTMLVDLIRTMMKSPDCQPEVCLLASLNLLMIICEECEITTQQLRQLFQQSLIKFDKRMNEKLN